MREEEKKKQKAKILLDTIQHCVYNEAAAVNL